MIRFGSGFLALVIRGLSSLTPGPHSFPLGHPGILTLPGLRMVQGYYYMQSHWQSWPSKILWFSWIVISIGGAILLWARRKILELPFIEKTFACIYTAFLVFYNFDAIVLILPRYILPGLPFILFALRKWIPQDRRVLWPAVALALTFETVVLFGLKTVFGISVPWLTPKPWE